MLSAALVACGSERASAPSAAPSEATPAVPAPALPPLVERAFPLPGSPGAVALRVSLASVELAVTDVHHARFATLPAREHASLVFNGGFFDREFEPEGLVVERGVVLSDHVESLSGGVVWVRDHVASLAATEGFVLPEGTDFAIQCRPRLVVDGAVNIASETGRRDARTALCLRDGGRTLDVILAPADNDEGPTLLELAVALHADGCESALNLDGGPSTAGAWVSPTGTRAFEPFGPVRQAVVVRIP